MQHALAPAVGLADLGTRKVARHASGEGGVQPSAEPGTVEARPCAV